MKRPKTELEAVVIYQKGSDGEWIPRRIERQSWVRLNAPKRGKWAHCGDLKALITGFRLKPNSTTIESVRVAHAYSTKQLHLQHGKSAGNVNYLYPSNYEDWEDPGCILDVIVCMHAEVGELTRGTRTHKELLDAGVFFYNASYSPPTKSGQFGKLTPLPLPALNDPRWHVPDMSTSEAFRHKMFHDFQVAMKPSTGSRVCSIQWYMPLHVMCDLFSVQCHGGMHRTATLFVFKPISEALFASLLDEGWDTKIVISKDVIKCHVLRDSVVFRYHIGRSMMYSMFAYIRERLVNGSEWVTMDQADLSAMLSIEVFLVDGTSMIFQVGKTWSLSNLREELNFYLSDDQDPGWFFYIEGALTKGNKKINSRQEKKYFMNEIGEGNSLRLQYIK